MEFNALVWAKAQDGHWHRGTVISRQEKDDLRFIKVCEDVSHTHTHTQPLTVVASLLLLQL